MLVLPLDKARAHQLELPALKKYDYSEFLKNTIIQNEVSHFKMFRALYITPMVVFFMVQILPLMLGKYDVIATGLDITSVDISSKITLSVIESEFDLKGDVVVVPKENILSVSETFFVSIKDDEGMAQSLT